MAYPTAPQRIDQVQQAIVVLMDNTLKELRSSAPASLDSADLTVENCIFQSFDLSIRRQLEPEWHRVGFKTRQVWCSTTLVYGVGHSLPPGQRFGRTRRE